MSELTAFTNKLALIDHGLDRLRGGDATALYDAIYLGVAAPGQESRAARSWCLSQTAETR